MQEILVATFYRFTRIDRIESMRSVIETTCREHGILGTVLLASEGINATIAGDPRGVLAVMDMIRSFPGFASLGWQESTSKSEPFKRLRVRTRRETVTMGLPHVDPNRSVGRYVDPEEWNRLLDDPEIMVIDARNDYEVAIGTFPEAVNPGIDSFGELASWLDENVEVGSSPKVAMFCTGGIRCEKSTALLRDRGLDEVFQLRGGILNYLNEIGGSRNRWRGSCFVFDGRIAVGHGLDPVEHEICEACQYPVRVGDGAGCRKCASSLGVDEI